MSMPYSNKNSRKVEIYRNAVKKTFNFLKKTTDLDDLLAKSIPLPEKEGFLVAVCELHAKDRELIQKFAQWRDENMFAFPTQFPVTIEGTEKWLRSRLLDVEDRILFLVLNPFGQVIGHLGFANALNDVCMLEIDNVVRGIKDEHPGIMGKAMKVLLNWAEETLIPDEIFLRVFNDNDHAIHFYHKLGFVNDIEIPLRKQEDGKVVSYISIEASDSIDPDRFFLRMVYHPKHKEMGEQMILTAGPSISAREASYALDAARYGWNNQWSFYIKKFEQTFADYLGVKYALSTSSCTGALHLALAALDIGPGDEVIVPDITWVATANAVAYVGATPIFADVEEDSWCLDPVSFESLITKKTKAVMPVHLYGHPARMSKIVEIARNHGLFIIEDAAPAIGAEFQGQKVGTFGDFAAFSFQGAKLVVTGEGGMLVTNNKTFYDKAYSLWDQGRLPGTFWINETGFKYKMSNIQASIGLGQIERVDVLIEKKRRIFSWYAENLKDVNGISLNQEMPWARSIYWMSSILLDENVGLDRDQFCKMLKNKNVDTRPVFPPISQYPIWNKPQNAQPVSQRIGKNAINLPSGVCLNRSQIDYICNCIKDIIGG